MLILPEEFPIATTLHAEGVCVANHYTAAPHPLRILLLNLMPQKKVTELDIARALAHADADIELLPMKISGQTYKTTPMEHMLQFYKDFENYEKQYFDGLIITGAPVEHLAFEEVRYWEQLCHIMDWSRLHVRSTLYICWGAQAGLYHHYGIPKHDLPAKKFGVFEQQILKDGMPLFYGMYPAFKMPNSRHTEVRRSDFPADADLTIVAEGPESGIGVVMGSSRREIFIVGHLEYEPYTLHHEYVRDLNKGLPIAAPQQYYEQDNPELGVNFSWEKAAIHFYSNWVEHYCKP